MTPASDLDLPTVDDVVVGAGSAGCVMAYRLAQAGRRVLVLEAGGPDSHDHIKIPAAFANLFRTSHDWDYWTVEQKHALGRRMYWPRGKMLGGSSSMNAQLYVRGNRLDYDTWRDELGCAGWGYPDLLPYFLRAEDNARGASDYHATGGPLRVEDLRYRHELTQAFVESAVASGMKRTDDFNGAQQDGVGFFQVTQKGGQRWSTADAYLRPALGTGRVTVVTGALVTRVDVEAGRAVGVSWLADGRPRSVRVEGEVVLSGGAVNSPQLLMLSGIGPASHLRELGVDVVADLPGVGGSLQDHLALPVIWRTQGTTALQDHETPLELVRWMLRKQGPLTSTVAEACGFFRSSPDEPAPDLQFHVAPAWFEDSSLSEPPARGFTIGPTLVAVESVGRIRLASADPRHRPEIDAGYLSDERDVDALVVGVEVAREIAALQPLAGYLASEALPGADTTNRDELRDFVRRGTQTLYHPVGTCRMGVDDEAVVDLEGRVRGVEGLRVVDASVMPRVPRGNTNAPTIAVAERLADAVLGRGPLAPYDPAAAPVPA